MICMEVNEMRISEFMKKVIVPVGTAVFLGALFLSSLCGARAV